MVVVLVVDIDFLLVGMVVVLAAERAAVDVAAAAVAHGQMGMSQCCDTDCQICKAS